jgi:TraM recognition site of TraD and TraG
MVYQQLYELLFSPDPAGPLTPLLLGWFWAQLPLGGAIGALAAVARCGWAELRRPSWQQRPSRRGPFVLARLAVVTWLLAHQRLISRRGGTNLGTDDRGRVIRLSHDETKGNVLITGALDSGKTTTGLEVLKPAVADGCPTFVIDLKNSPLLLAELGDAAARAGRPFHHFCFQASPYGNAYYDPLTRGDASRRKDLLISAGIWTEEHFRQVAEDYLQLVFQVIDATAAARPRGRAMLDEVIELISPDALADRAGSQPDDALITAAERWSRKLTPDERSALRGLQHRLVNLASSTAGAWIRTGPPTAATVDLAAVMRDRAVVVFSLDGQGYPKVAALLGALIIQDLQTLAGELIAARNQRIGYVFVDEFATLDRANILGLLNKAREAELRAMIATQSVADLMRHDEVFLRQVLELTNVKAIHRVNEAEAADQLSAQAGRTAGYTEQLRVELRTGLPGSLGVGAATGDGRVTPTRVRRFDPDELMELRAGRCALIVKAPTVRYAKQVRVVRTRPPGRLRLRRDLPAPAPRPLPAPAAALVGSGGEGTEGGWSLAPAPARQPAEQPDGHAQTTGPAAADTAPAEPTFDAREWEET